MSEVSILYIMNMTFCSREEALTLLEKNNGNIFESICEYFNAPLKEKKLDEIQLFFKKARKDLAEIEKRSVAALTSSNQSESLELNEKKNHHEEMVQQNNYFQICLPPSPESVD